MHQTPCWSLRYLVWPLLLLLSVAVQAQTELPWDPGATNTGTQVYTHPNTIAGQYQFHLVTEASVQGGWRTALRVTAGNADLYLRQGAHASTTEYHKKSERAGSDGFVLAPHEYAAGQDWYIMVNASAGASWSLVSGEIFVQDLGSIPYTDTNANNVFDIGETPGQNGSGALQIGAEATRFFKASAPPGTPAWSLYLNGVAKDILVRKGQAPVTAPDKGQNGRLLLVPPYLDGSTVFIGVSGAPGESINLDSRIQAVTDISFNTTQSAVAFSAAPFKLYRLTVPPNLLGWDVSVTPSGGDVNLAVRREIAAGEGDNDAYSEATGSAVDSVTLVPPGLTDGTWFITACGAAGATFTLRNSEPVATPIAFTDTKVNDQPLRAGWRYYALTDIPSQLGKLGWQLELTGHVAGTEIALRRNALPGRRVYRGNGLSGSFDTLDYSSVSGRLDRPNHQADVWYAGIYLNSVPLGTYTLNTREIPTTTMTFNSGSAVITNQPDNEWRWWRVDVPSTAGLLGWELKLTNVTSGSPGVVVRRGLLPDVVSSAGWGFSACSSTTWPQGNYWTHQHDFTNRDYDPSGTTPWRYKTMVIPMGRPLEPGTYYVGVGKTDSDAPMSYTLESRGIGTGFAVGVTTLGDAATASSQPTGALAPRAHRFFKATVPAGLRSWEVVLTPTSGEMSLTVRKGSLPAPENFDNVDNLAGRQMQKEGRERYVLLPHNGQDFLDAGDYYFAVASEGQNPTSFSIGTGDATGTLANNGPLVQTDLGTATAGGVSIPVSLEGGQIKAYRVLAPAGTISLEARLDSRVGAPAIAFGSGSRLPAAFTNTSYGFDFGQTDGTERNLSIATVSQAPAGEYRILVNGYFTGDSPAYPDSTATLVVTARTPPNVSFNGGTSVVTGHQSGGWRFFRMDVPAGVLGWDVNLANMTGQAINEPSPAIMICRDVLTTAFGTTHNFGNGDTLWPSGNRWVQQMDYTGRELEFDGNLRRFRSFTAAMGRPLEPGTYYACVQNPGATAVSYTFESRGIGAGQALPVTTLAFTGGTAVVNALPVRRSSYYKVTIPANTPSWELKMEPSAGEVMLTVLRGSIPDGMGGDILHNGGSRIQKTDGERFLVLPSQGEDFLLPGDYYIAVTGEGGDPPNPGTTGTGTSSGTLTSIGALPVTNLGNATTTPTNTAVSLVSIQSKAWQITVPAGASSLDVVLDTTAGKPVLTAVPGARLPGSAETQYGWYGGLTPVNGANEFHITSPAAGVWSFLVRANDDPATSTWPAATGTLHISIAAGPEPLTFNGGSASVSGQSAGTWKFWEVTVPSGVLGWDLRIVNVTAGHPRMVVRRGHLPEGLNNGGFFAAYDTWPDGASRGTYYDMTQRQNEPDGRNSYGQYMVASMGSPLEPGTYFVGITNEPTISNPMSYTLESRGIGTDQTIGVTTLALNGSLPVASTPARMAKYYKVTIPANTPSWEVTLSPAAGDLCLGLRKGALPDLENPGSIYGGGGRLQQQPDSERFVLLPPAPEAFLTPGDYYLAAVSEGVNPGVPGFSYIGTGSSSGTIASSSPLAVVNLGAATAAGSSTPVTLTSGQAKAFRFTVPAGAPGLEVRLDNRVGDPGMHLRGDALLPEAYYYSSQGGMPGAYNGYAISIPSPVAGTWSLTLDTQSAGSAPAPASANLIVRVLQPQQLNFSSTENGNGFSHMDSRTLINGQRQFYEVQAPATLGGQPIAGWWLKLDTSSSQCYLRVRDTADFSSSNYTGTAFGEDIVMAPPYFQGGRTWYVEVEAFGTVSYTLTSQPAVLGHAPYTMPATPNNTFADTGAGLPGDQGIDLADDAWHFYAFDVPAGNGGLLRAELRALNGNPDLLLRSGGIPTSHHDSDGPVFGGQPLLHYQLNGTGSQYGNWTPVSSRTERELAPGRWYAAVHASPGSNARYRLLLSTGDVQTLALNGGSVSAQNLAPNDVRYYKFTVPLDSPLNWNLTFSETIGDVRMFVRDTIPPGDTPFINSGSTQLSHWGTDGKNQGPYPICETSGTYALTTPPLRPAHTYYVGVQALNSAQYSLSSTTSGGTIGNFPVVDIYTGVIDTSLTAGQRKIYRVPVPAGALRWKHTATHDAGVRIIIEQGTIPLETSQHYVSFGADTSLNRSLVTFGFPWFPNNDYCILLANDSGSTQNVVLTMDGRDAATEDEDHDGIADPWEQTYFGGSFGDGSGDLDGDGLSDLLEYVLGLNPAQSSAGSIPATTITSGANPHLALDIPLPAVIPPQARLEVFGSSELGAPGTSIAVRPPGGSWTGSTTPIPGGVRVIDPLPYNTTSRRFLWLTVTTVPEP